MLTQAAQRTVDFGRNVGIGVHSPQELERLGCTRSARRARIAARRWQRVGVAVVLHNDELTREQRWAAAVINCGPRAVLASFSAAESVGLRGWERDEIHVLAPTGVARPRVPGLPIVLHYARTIDDVYPMRRLQRPEAAVILAASAMGSPRQSCELLASAVQQRLTTAPQLRSRIDARPTLRHRRLLLAAVDDIGMGAQALSEIDFVRLCRRYHVPAPTLQAVRAEPGGRRRYLDAEWKRDDGRRVAVEVDGALHLAARRWWDDQLRQNEIALTRTLVLRYPSVILRTQPELVAGQLDRGLNGAW